jgi:hypothetical protein
MEALIRSIRSKTPLLSAAILYGAMLEPIGGGEGSLGIVGRLEERPGIAVQVIIYVTMDGTRPILDKREYIEKKHLLLPAS